MAGFPDLMFFEGTSAHTEEDIAKLFSSHFELLFCSGDTSSFNAACIQQGIFDDMEIEINERDINSAIYNLKAPNSISPDGISGSFIKQFASYLSKPLLYLFNLSLCAPYH